MKKVKTSIRIRKWILRHWVNFVVVLIVLFTIVVIFTFFYFEWPKVSPPKERLFGTPSYIWFGLSTVGSLVVSLLVLATIRKKVFADSNELLKRFIAIFDEARYYKGDVQVSLLHFVPCPGLFDETFKKKTWPFSRGPKFATLRKRISQVNTKSNVTIRIVMLNRVDRLRFLKAFYKHEKQEVSKRNIEAAGGEKAYYRNAIGFIKDTFDDFCISEINSEWLDKALNGDKFVILGAAEKTGFIGSISFEGGEFQFEAADYEGDAQVVHMLFDQLVKIYE